MKIRIDAAFVIMTMLVGLYLGASVAAGEAHRGIAMQMLAFICTFILTLGVAAIVAFCVVFILHLLLGDEPDNS